MTTAKPPLSPAALAQSLVDARKNKHPVAAADVVAGLRDAADAYAAQRIACELMPELRTGTPPAWKSGGPSRDTPLTHAALPASGVMASPADASAMHFNHRWIEAEVALRLGKDGEPDAMTVSIEIVDTRWSEGRDAPALAKLADLQSHGALVLGAWVPYESKDWLKQRCEVRIGDTVREFTGTHSLVDPAWLLPTWKAHVASQGGDLPAGSVVTTGTWCGLLQAQKGDRVEVRFDGIGSASVQL
jgi:2-keto-4-pentenoate hydratase